MNEIVAFITALGHTTNIAKALIQARDEVKRGELAIEFNEALIGIQTHQITLIEKYQSLLAANEALNKQLAYYDKWEQESTRYALASVGPGAMVYVLDPAQPSAEAPHWLCTHCYENRHKSMLQRSGPLIGHYKCPRCGAEIDAKQRYPAA